MKAVFAAWGHSLRAVRQPGFIRSIVAASLRESLGYCAQAVMLFGVVYLAEQALQSIPHAGSVLWTLYTLGIVIHSVPRMMASVFGAPVTSWQYVRHMVDYHLELWGYMLLSIILAVGGIALFSGTINVQYVYQFKPYLVLVRAVIGGWLGFAICARIDDKSDFGKGLRRGWRMLVFELPVLGAALLVFLPFGAYLTYHNVLYSYIVPVTFFAKLRYLGTVCWQLMTWALFIHIYHRRRIDPPVIMPDHDDADDALGDEY